MDFERQMSNVSFGGNWSEELVELAHIRALLANLEWAVENCTERDVNTQAVRQSLEYIHNHIDKGPMLTARWNRGYAIEIVFRINSSYWIFEDTKVKAFEPVQ